MFCVNCGKEVDENAVICVNCGCAIKKIKQKKERNNKETINIITLISFLAWVVFHIVAAVDEWIFYEVSIFSLVASSVFLAGMLTAFGFLFTERKKLWLTQYLHVIMLLAYSVYDFVYFLAYTIICY